MQEIEVKVLEVDVPALERKLAELGAKRVRSGHVKQSVYRKDGKKRPIVRLRDNCGRFELCVKRPVSKEGAKIMQEDEVQVANLDKAHRVLLALGYEKQFSGEKERTSYVRNEIHYDIDTYPGYPPLLEIEGPSLKAIERAAKELGYTKQQLLPWGFKELRKHYEKSEKNEKK